MFSKRSALIVAVVTMIIAGLGGGIAQALPSAQQRTSGTTIPYAGRLTDEAGRPVADGDYAFTFALYDAATAGTLLWSEVQEGIAVREGGFVASLGSSNPIPTTLLSGGERWLEVAVRAPGASTFTALSPRQSLRAAAPAQPAGVNQAAPCPHDHWGESWGDSTLGVAFPGPFVALYGHSNAFGGVLGQSASNIGVYGTSTSGVGVYGESTNDIGGVFEGSDTVGYAADISLEGDPGRIVAYGGTNSRMSLRSNGNVIIAIDSDQNGNNSFYIDSGPTILCSVNESGDLSCTGTKSAVVDTPDYGRRKLYAVESPEVWHEDLGTAALVNGEATVAFEPIFAQTVNLEEEYHVFLTPISQEPVWLYVTSKTPAGFTVRGVTLDGKPASCSFDYRVVAKRLGYEDVRLAPVTEPAGGGE